MITSGYTMDIYCDCEACQADPFAYAEWKADRGFAEYAGQSWRECAKKARKDGWKISKNRINAFAPGHKIRSVADE